MSMNRRQFLKGLAAAATVPVAAGVAQALSPAATETFYGGSDGGLMTATRAARQFEEGIRRVVAEQDFFTESPGMAVGDRIEFDPPMGWAWLDPKGLHRKVRVRRG
jgi:hypothetical protein